jgi:hypothetical protein
MTVEPSLGRTSPRFQHGLSYPKDRITTLVDTRIR